MIYEVERSRPKKKPDTEFIIVRTTGIGPEVVDWLNKNFGPSEPSDINARWFIVVRSIFFRHEKDYVWFQLRWGSRPVYRRA